MTKIIKRNVAIMRLVPADSFQIGTDDVPPRLPVGSTGYFSERATGSQGRIIQLLHCMFPTTNQLFEAFRKTIGHQPAKAWRNEVLLAPDHSVGRVR
ncbi:MAG: hypothetical protein M2R45_03792 [Verrucomicrobia subdivision 3 bacterium]|nr:hypothetical protein [Limisphaerales bacterium]MCS1416767.1 hypothetical protein [Limisphaerales bacterium]